MNLLQILIPLASVAALVAGYAWYGWGGVAVAGGALTMWLLLHMTRVLQVLKRAAARPIGYVDSAVMLNAKLKRGMTLLHVVAMTRALGALASAKGAQPEHYHWTDSSDSRVSCTFVNGKLTEHSLFRPGAGAS